MRRPSTYERIAAILASNMRAARYGAPDWDSKRRAVATVAQIAHDLADIYSMSDPGFSRTRFLRQSGVGV